jgi:hypothetical protein
MAGNYSMRGFLSSMSQDVSCAVTRLTSLQTVNGPVGTIHASIKQIICPALAKRMLAVMFHRQEESRECIFDLMRGAKCVGSFQ